MLILKRMDIAQLSFKVHSLRDLNRRLRSAADKCNAAADALEDLVKNSIAVNVELEVTDAADSSA